MFITLEGIEGSGKSTMLLGLKNYFENLGRSVLCTREPGGSALGLQLRALLLNEETKIHSRAELFLFLADRAQHVEEVLRPALAKGTIVLCDRYIHSTFAYQGAGRGIELAELKKFNDFAMDNLMPHKVLLLDLDVEEGLFRAQKRNLTLQNNEGRFDAECIAFHQMVRQSFLRQAAEDTERFCIINAVQKQEDVLRDCINALKVN